MKEGKGDGGTKRMYKKNEQRKKLTNEWMNEWTNERMNYGTKEQIDKWAIELMINKK